MTGTTHQDYVDMLDGLRAAVRAVDAPPLGEGPVEDFLTCVVGLLATDDELGVSLADAARIVARHADGLRTARPPAGQDEARAFWAGDEGHGVAWRFQMATACEVAGRRRAGHGSPLPGPSGPEDGWWDQGAYEVVHRLIASIEGVLRPMPSPRAPAPAPPPKPERQGLSLTGWVA